jgi:hypothetical protein
MRAQRSPTSPPIPGLKCQKGEERGQGVSCCMVLGSQNIARAKDGEGDYRYSIPKIILDIHIKLLIHCSDKVLQDPNQFRLTIQLSQMQYEQY